LARDVTWGGFFKAQEGTPGRHRVAVLAHGVRQRLFGDDTSVTGQLIELNRKSYEVIGVMSAAFGLPLSAELWMPAALDPAGFLPQFRLVGRARDVRQVAA
jgi:hypothetical protein